MAKRRFMTAKDDGYTHFRAYSCRYETLEDLIFEMMANNPYKSEKSQKDYIAGASEACNQIAIYRNNRRDELIAQRKREQGY